MSLCAIINSVYIMYSPYICSNPYIILICEVICSVGLRKYSANSIPRGLSHVGLNPKVLECQVLFGVSLCFMCFSWLSKTTHYAHIEVHVAGILGRRRGEPNSRQGHVPMERANNASANPSPTTALWPHPVACRTLWWERTRGPTCSYTQPGIRQPRAPGLSAN